jgi:hypothetical protein
MAKKKTNIKNSSFEITKKKNEGKRVARRGFIASLCIIVKAGFFLRLHLDDTFIKILMIHLFPNPTNTRI